MRAKLDDYLKVLDAYRALPRPGGYPPDHEMRTELRRKEPTVKRVLGVLDHELADWSLDSIAGEEPARDAVFRGLGILDDQDEWAENLSPEGPVLPADRMHPWVWDAAMTLWDSGHYRQAVHAAATAINAHTQAKVARRDIADDKLMQEIFSDDPPRPGRSRLRCPGDPMDQTVHSRQRGARQYAVGCFFAIRNPAAHEDMEWAQQEALEYLGSLSVLARWIDSWRLDTSV
jgi:hypothetical protein